jgi:hypothetical protein
MQNELLRLCGYAPNPKSLERLEQIRKNYSRFDDIVKALLDLEPFLKRSDYYLSLQGDCDMIEIRSTMLEEDEFSMMDSDIIVWANQHGIELQEEFDRISILGFKGDATS